MNINGRFNPEISQISFRGITNYSNFISIDIEQFTAPEEVSKAIEKILTSYLSEGDGAYVWIVPDGYMASLTKEEKEWEAGGGGYFSHESILLYIKYRLSSNGFKRRIGFAYFLAYFLT